MVCKIEQLSCVCDGQFSLTLMLQLMSIMEREALEASQSSTVPPSKYQQEELFLFPAENSTLTTLPGVARVVHSKASCTVHWLESGKTRPSAKELPAAQILGIHTALPPRGGSRSGRGSSAIYNASAAVLADARQTEPPNSEPSPDSSGKVEEKRPFFLSVSSQPTAAPSEEGSGLESSETLTCSDVEASGGLEVNRSTEKSCCGAESSSEQCKEEQNNDSTQTPSGKPPSSDESPSQASVPPARERTVEHIREEGWSARDGENVTLAELYLMFGKPGKLQLEYEWQPAEVVQPRPNRTNRVLRCLLKLISTEVNPKPLVKKKKKITFTTLTSVVCLSRFFKH